jgi:hypothetical protein
MVLHDKGGKMNDLDDVTIDELSPDRCPVCDSDNLSYGDADRIPEKTVYLQEMRCKDCNSTWNITFTRCLQSVECVQDADGNELAIIID